MESNKKIQTLTFGALIAAMYVVLTFLSSMLGLANGQIQVRISEALTVLPVFTPAAIPGLTIGCVLANLLTGCAGPDVIFGSLATLLGALGTYALKKHRILSLLPPVVSNAIIIPLVLKYFYGIVPLSFSFLTIFIGEMISAFGLGYALRSGLEKTNMMH